jgi:hypothetical protein
VDTDLPPEHNPESESTPEPAPTPTPEAAPEPVAPAVAAPVVIPADMTAAGATPPVFPASPTFPTTAAPQIPQETSYRDRSTGLILFGVLQIVLGLMSALMVPFAALGAFMSRLTPGGGMRPAQFLSGVSIYAFLAVLLLCLGIGSIQAKRWARALTLVISCYWLVSGALGTVLMTAILPVFMRSFLQAQRNMGRSTPSPEMSTGVMAVILTIIIVFMAFFLIVVPIAFVVFYSRRDVAETCRHRDAIERWTDRTPLPVLGASVVLAVQGFYLLLTGLTMPVFPFFGKYLHGIAAVGCFLLVAGLDAYFAVGFFRLKSAAWWTAAVVVPIRLLSMTLTYARTNMMEAYSQSGMSEEQLRMINGSPLSNSHITLWWSLLTVVILYSYLLWLKRYFKAPVTEQQAQALPA